MTFMSQKSNWLDNLIVYKYALGFMLVYLAVLVFLLILVETGQTSFAFSSIIRFLTSPFNPIENFSNAYPNLAIGELSNLGFVAFILFATQFYMRNLMAVFKGYIAYSMLFWSGILASYITSAGYWLTTGTPSTGTSIIAFGFLLFLVVSTILDITYYYRNKNFVRAYWSFAAALVCGILAYTYTGMEIHLIGGALFLLILFIYLKMSKT